VEKGYCKILESAWAMPPRSTTAWNASVAQAPRPHQFGLSPALTSSGPPSLGPHQLGPPIPRPSSARAPPSALTSLERSGPLRGALLGPPRPHPPSLLLAQSGRDLVLYSRSPSTQAVQLHLRPGPADTRAQVHRVLQCEGAIPNGCSVVPGDPAEHHALSLLHDGGGKRTWLLS
jgi:hypothetical protein